LHYEHGPAPSRRREESESLCVDFEEAARYDASMRRFELSDSSSNKFWEVRAEGKVLTVSFGRVGAIGITKTKAFPSPERALGEHDKLIGEKSRKGYKEVGHDGLAKGTPKGRAKASASKPASPAKSTGASGKLLLARLDTWLRCERPKFYTAFEKGASAAVLGRLEKAVGPLPPTLRALFAWKGGNVGRLQGNWSLISAAQAHSDNASMTDLLDVGEFDEPSWWNRAWVPFVEDGGGNHLCVDLAGAFGGPPGQVVEFWHDDADRPVLYPSVDAWLEVFVDVLESGAYVEESGGLLNAPEGSVRKASARVCPGYPKRHSAVAHAAARKTAGSGAAKGTTSKLHPAAMPSGATAPKATTRLGKCETSEWSVSANGSRFAYAVGKGNTSTRIICDGVEGPQHDKVSTPWFSDDDRLVYCARDGKAWTAYIGNEAFGEFDEQPNVVLSGKHYALHGRRGKGSVLVHDDARKNVDGQIACLRLTAGGAVAFISGVGGKYFEDSYRVFLGEKLLATHRGLTVHGFDVSPDGKHVLYETRKEGKRDDDLPQFSVHIDGKPVVLPDVDRSSCDPGYSPRGELYYSVGDDFLLGQTRHRGMRGNKAFFDALGTLYAVDDASELYDAKGKKVGDDVKMHAFHVTSGFALTNGTHVRFGKKRLGAFDEVKALTFSSDGKRLMFASQKHDAITWNVVT